MCGIARVSPGGTSENKEEAVARQDSRAHEKQAAEYRRELARGLGDAVRGELRA